jgi:hypothetical protein
MPRQVDDEERKAELYEFRAALAFLVVMFVLVVGGLCLSTYLCWIMVRSFLSR